MPSVVGDTEQGESYKSVYWYGHWKSVWYYLWKLKNMYSLTQKLQSYVSTCAVGDIDENVHSSITPVAQTEKRPMSLLEWIHRL